MPEAEVVLADEEAPAPLAEAEVPEAEVVESTASMAAATLPPQC